MPQDSDMVWRRGMRPNPVAPVKPVLSTRALSVILLLVINLLGFGALVGAHSGSGVDRESTIAESDTSSADHGADFSIIDSMFVVHFHPDVQCSCCINVGEFANESLETHYADVLEAGKLSHKEYNIDDDSYSESNYEVSDAALAFEAFTDEGRTFEVIESVWDHCKDRDKFIANFQEELDSFVLELTVADSVSEAPDEATLPEKPAGLVRQLPKRRLE